MKLFIKILKLKIKEQVCKIKGHKLITLKYLNINNEFKFCKRCRNVVDTYNPLICRKPMFEESFIVTFYETQRSMNEHLSEDIFSSDSK